ncbi:TolC family protein [Mucilaginibacter sp. E4BP6]|uniref:TolC family protein n=1 Tax=Mucilaginibacter sp. E4BP6 TaxID=2723089 RepID=UPI0015C77A3B|nr:TolC family protein [Mucilaginibacter sp. E4BP6]NYE66402.1 outer membrane protein TolC [Mucilaginibacter sp. E4BP6]
MKYRLSGFTKLNDYTSFLTLRVLLIACFSFVIINSFAQTPDTNKLFVPIARDTANKAKDYFTLKQCIDYALQHEPFINNALIGVDIAHATNAINLSGWLPQVNANGDLIHYFQQSNGASVIPGATTTGGTSGTTTGGTTTGGTGTTTGGTTSGSSSTATRTTYANTFVPELQVSQAIFSPSLLYASKSAPLYIQQAQQVSDSTKIFIVSTVSKSFYNVLLTLEQINVLKEDTARLGRSLRDSYHQYVGGIVDETDYEEAEISLNNSKAQLKQANENVVPEYAILKQYMGYPPGKQFDVNFDTLQMMRDIRIDTAQQLDYEKRIEVQQLKTQKALQNQLVNYYRTSFLPTVSAFFDYDLDFENNHASDLFNSSYPTSLVGLSVSIPIFTGFYRTNNLRKARLQERQLEWNDVDLKSQIYSQYTSALANYKGNFYNLELLQKNVALAKRVYFVVQLQYKQGIVAYLNVITAESNLISSEISYLNALFTVLSNKIDLEKSMGTITY